MSLVDKMVLESQLRRVRSDIESVERSIANKEQECAKDVTRLTAYAASLRSEAERLDDALSWLRMHELLHTPCWRYRVAG
jgi:hypothetical protein